MLARVINPGRARKERLEKLQEATVAFLECARYALPDAVEGGLLREVLSAAKSETDPGTPASILVALRDELESDGGCC